MRNARDRALPSRTRQAIKDIFSRLDYGVLGDVYCEEGGEAFWKAHKKKCQTMGIRIAEALKRRLSQKGRSLYVGAGVAELPMMVLETLDMNRTVEAYNIREPEVRILNRACDGLPFTVQASRAQTAKGTFDHVWMTSVLNDPECFPETSALSYGRADPVRFDPVAFQRERTRIQDLLDACLPKLSRPGLLSTTVEEATWMADWLTRHGIPFYVEEQRYPTAIVGDPLCFIRIEPEKNERKGIALLSGYATLFLTLTLILSHQGREDMRQRRGGQGEFCRAPGMDDRWAANTACTCFPCLSSRSLALANTCSTNIQSAAVTL